MLALRQTLETLGFYGEEGAIKDPMAYFEWRHRLTGPLSRDQSLWTVIDLGQEEQSYDKNFPFVPSTVIAGKDKLAMFWWDGGSSTIYIWDLTADQSRKIGSIGNVTLWHMNVDENMLVTFEIDWNQHLPMVQQTKWTLAGQLLDRKRFPLSPSGCVHVRLIKETRLPLERHYRRCYKFGHKTITRVASRDDENVMMDLVYDSTIDRFSAVSPNANRLLDNHSTLITPYISYHYDSSLNRLHICNTANGTSRIYPYQQDRQEVTGGQRVVFGDREVLCVQNDVGIQMWCFNPNFVCPIGHPKRGFFFLPMEENG
ncbi:hypothetical protein VTN49DRAFT_6636 [Thermomyces lanuginosus]|uniref:uncharacterized protein n=1 Tax=Thermomyces lanuginosus TaxID=5541 RepID=UPI0037440E7E